MYLKIASSDWYQGRNVHCWKMSSNNAIIVLKGKTTGPIVKGEVLDYVKRPYEFDNLRDGDIVVQAMYLSVDPYLVKT